MPTAKIVSKHPQTKVYCKVFEDNSGALEMAKNPKIRPRTKHLNIKYHHFRSWIAQDGEDTKNKIQIYAIKSSEQQADMLTEAVDQACFVKFSQVGVWVVMAIFMLLLCVGRLFFM